MRFAKIVVLGICAAMIRICPAPTAGAAEVNLASEGKSNYSIILPEKAPESVQAAAGELRKDIALASGATLPIHKDTDKVDAPYISLGETKQATSAGFSAKDMPLEGWRIVTRDGNLYIFGPDTPDGGWTKDNGVSNGTAHGVYTFLEDVVGVRWLMPGDLGRVVPSQTTLTLDSIDRSGAPQFHNRYISYLQMYSNPRQFSAIQRWEQRLRIGKFNTSVGISAGHSWWKTINRSVPESKQGQRSDTLAVKQLHQKHPEWFAMDSTGKRPLPTTKYDKLETTNPELVKWFAGQVIQYLKASDRPAIYSLSPSDGTRWSQSPQSKALYDPSRREDREFGTSSLVLKWYHGIAQIVAKQYPQGRLTGYLYSSYLYPPTKVDARLPENFTPIIAPSFDYGYRLYRKDVRDKLRYVMETWEKIVQGRWYYYDILNRVGANSKYEIGSAGVFPGSTGLVTPAAPDILNYVFPILLNNRIDGGQIYGDPAWSSEAMKNYIIAKMLWNPKLNAYDVRRDWLEHAYGKPAASVMATFHDRLNEWFSDYYNAHSPQEAGYRFTLDMLKTIYGGHYPEMEKLFLEAQSRPMTEPQKQRLQLIGDNLIVLQWRLKNAGYLPADYTSSLTRSNDQVIAILGRKNEAFPLFAGVVGADRDGYRYRSRYNPGQVPIQWTDAPEVVKGDSPKWRDNTIVLYARQDATVQIESERVRQAAYFASFEIIDAKGNVLTQGVFNEGTPVQFQAKANQPYFLWIPSRNRVQYILSVRNADVAEGGLRGKALHLSGRGNAPIQVYYAGDQVGLTRQDGDVKITRPFVGSGHINGMRQSGQYAAARVLASLTANWKFKPDPDDRLMKQGVTKLDFDDRKWADISPLNWWQFQDFKDYHGPAWYRVTFTLPKLNPGEQTLLYFGSIDGNAEVYLNGHKIGEHKIGPPPHYKGWDRHFLFRVPPDLWQSGPNVLAVKVTSKSDTGASGITGGLSVIGYVKADK